MRLCVWVCVSVCVEWVYLYRGGGQQGHIIAANIYRGNRYTYVKRATERVGV